MFGKNRISFDQIPGKQTLESWSPGTLSHDSLGEEPEIIKARSAKMTYKPIPDAIEALKFDNRFVRELPADPEPANNRRPVYGACFSRVKPQKTRSPQLVAYSREVADLLDLPPAVCATDYFTHLFAGNVLAPRMDPYATCYGGHQFGNWAGQLGDGRAINLGEVINRRSQRWALQLKGAGPTPYSRTADGLAVLRSSIREFLCSEAMYHLGVPTTRALSLVLTGEEVERDMFYDGHPRMEPGAVVCRVAPSFTRFGNFEIFTSRNDLKVLKQLLDYTLITDFPHLGDPSPDVYAQWFAEVCKTTAELMVHWMRVGFVHGVMNTDNMSILGLTIDYGPYGWLEDYNPNWTPNTTDAATRRYAFGAQPRIAHWNLHQLANAVFPLVENAEPLEKALALYGDHFQTGWQQMMAAKLGLPAPVPDADAGLFKELPAILSLVETDMTLFFRNLAKIDVAVTGLAGKGIDPLNSPLKSAYYRPEQITPAYADRLNSWIETYGRHARADTLSHAERARNMNVVNPKYVLRNYLAQLAIEKAEQGDFGLVRELLELLRRPYDE
jgi:uncharacterized protein YdiU (UPF0061 family)